MSTAPDFINTYTARFNADAAAGLDLVFQFDLEGTGSYHMIIRDGACQVVEGAADEPNVTLITDTDTFKEIAEGETDGMQAFMMGKLRAEGEMMLAMKLAELFPN